MNHVMVAMAQTTQTAMLVKVVTYLLLIEIYVEAECAAFHHASSIVDCITTIS